jgi:hypothetical protein
VDDHSPLVDLSEWPQRTRLIVVPASADDIIWAQRRLLGDIGGRPPEDLVLDLSRAQLMAQEYELGPLVGVEARPEVAVDVFLFPPAAGMRWRCRDRRHLGRGLVTGSGQFDRTLTELVWIAHWHRDIFPSDALDASRSVSAKAGKVIADPVGSGSLTSWARMPRAG